MVVQSPPKLKAGADLTKACDKLQTRLQPFRNDTKRNEEAENHNLVNNSSISPFYNLKD
jgi:hypothetical protein